MKGYDVVELIRGRDRYAKEGVYKGMFGGIMSEKPINGEWYVIFSEHGTERDIADIMVQEEDSRVHDRIPPQKP